MKGVFFATLFFVCISGVAGVWVMDLKGFPAPPCKIRGIQFPAYLSNSHSGRVSDLHPNESNTSVRGRRGQPSKVQLGAGDANRKLA
jgi:hypothetical protein